MLARARKLILKMFFVALLLQGGQVCAQSLPTGWTDGDIGSVGLAGSATYANGVFTVKGAGATVGSYADGFHFVYLPLSGDGTIVARITSIQGGSNTQIGVIIRETLNANSTNAITFCNNSSTFPTTFYGRLTTGGYESGYSNLNLTLPGWLKVVRSGSAFTGYGSSDGVNWVQVSPSITINMAQNAYVGLAVSSNSLSSLSTSTFDNVSVNSTTAPAPTATAKASFDETIEVAVRLGVDPRKADQIVRGTLSLPAGTGRTARVVVFAAGEKAADARKAGADVVGADDLVARVKEGFLDFDIAIATPDLMGKVGKLGRLLGPRGLMPNPKTGTVTPDVGRAVTDFKGGRIEYRTDRYGNVHMPIGKASFTQQALVENYEAGLDELLRVKPAAAKGKYLKSVTISSTMGPGVRVDPTKTRDLVEEAAKTTV